MFGDGLVGVVGQVLVLFGNIWKGFGWFGKGSFKYYVITLGGEGV